jgi:hypothetical protein
MTEVQKLPAFPEGTRPETGPLQFGDDWPGVFIRGDNALADAQALDAALRLLPADAWPVRAMLEGLRNTLQSCRVGDTGWPP